MSGADDALGSGLANMVTNKLFNGFKSGTPYNPFTYQAPPPSPDQSSWFSGTQYNPSPEQIAQGPYGSHTNTPTPDPAQNQTGGLGTPAYAPPAAPPLDEKIRLWETGNPDPSGIPFDPQSPEAVASLLRRANAPKVNTTQDYNNVGA